MIIEPGHSKVRHALDGFTIYGERRVIMQGPGINTLGRDGGIVAWRAILIGAGALALAGCTSVPDYANPVEGYYGVVDTFDDEAETDVAAPQPVPGADEPYPNLSEVPEAPSRETSVAEMDTVAEGLIADRENARYTDEEIRRQGDETTSLAAPEETAPVVMAEPVPPAETVIMEPAPEERAQVPEAPPMPAAQTSADAWPQAALQPAAGIAQPAAGIAQPAAGIAQPAAGIAQPAMPSPTYQSAATAVPAYSPTPVAAPSPVYTPASAPVYQPTAPADVKRAFGNYFSASGPAAVAPPPSQTQIAMAAGGSVPLDTPVASGVTTAQSLTDYSPLRAGASVRAAVIIFGTGSAKLSGEGRRALREVAKLYKERGGSVVRVIGHASNRTREMSAEKHALVNFDVSLRRAHTVADELIRLGVPARILYIGAVSDNEPVYFEWMPSGEAGNRRAEVFIDF